MTTTDDVRALTLRQPWATLVAEHGKDVENRTWPTRWRGTLLIHAGQGFDPGCPPSARRRTPALPAGAFLAAAALTDCHQHRPGCCASTWAEPDAYHWVLTGIRPLSVPVPCSGARGLWRPDPELIALARRRLSRAAAR